MAPLAGALEVTEAEASHHPWIPSGNLTAELEVVAAVALARQHFDTSYAEKFSIREMGLGALHSLDYNQCVLPPVGTLALLSQSRRSVGV